MEDRTLSILGLVGVVSVLVVAVLGVYGFVEGYLLESPGDVLVPTLVTLVLTALVVVLLSKLGARSRQWRQNTYW